MQQLKHYIPVICFVETLNNMCRLAGRQQPATDGHALATIIKSIMVFTFLLKSAINYFIILLVINAPLMQRTDFIFIFSGGRCWVTH